MLIGNRYSDNKLYRGLKHYDSLPLTSGDLHEYADILQMKNAFIMNNLLGSGILNEPKISISSTGAKLSEPAVVLLDGDISLVHSSNELLSISDINESGISEGVLCVVGWYQALTSTSTLREYGGVRNNIIQNDIIDSRLNVQVSTRYQLRWDTVLLRKSLIESGNPNISCNLINRDATGELTTGVTLINTTSKIGEIYIAPRPTSMDYAVSDLYIVPVLCYKYNGHEFTEIKSVKKIKPEGSTGLIKSKTEPVDAVDGDIWYNPDTFKFKFYIEGVGFVPTASDITMKQYHNTVDITNNQEDADISIPISIPEYTEDDILQVIYGGVVLTEGLNYSINHTNRTITLMNFSTEIGDTVTFIAIKLVGSGNTSSSSSAGLEAHINTIGSSEIKGHLGLSDTISPLSDTSNGVAATPKAVYDATTIKDTVTGKSYRLTMTDGILGIIEVS